MAPRITIEPSRRPVAVRSSEAVIAESGSALVLREEGREPVFYLPREAMDPAFAEPSATRTTCPWKGEATYWHVSTPGGLIRDAVWSYENPRPEVAAIRGHVAFDAARLAVEPL